MKKYSKFQFGWLVVVVFILVVIWISAAYLNQWGNNPITKPVYIFFLVLFGGILFSFYGMTVTVDEKLIIIKMGIGLIKKKYPLSSVKSVEIVKYPVFYGYGIRIIPNGVLFNISGKHAVELRFKSGRQVIQIGTNDESNLKSILEENIQIIALHSGSN
jgi:hypothetical protein